MLDRSWLMGSFPTPLIFRYHLPLKSFLFHSTKCMVWISSTICLRIFREGGPKEFSLPFNIVYGMNIFNCLPRNFPREWTSRGVQLTWTLPDSQGSLSAKRSKGHCKKSNGIQLPSGNITNCGKGSGGILDRRIAINYNSTQTNFKGKSCMYWTVYMNKFKLCGERVISIT